MFSSQKLRIWLNYRDFRLNTFSVVLLGHPPCTNYLLCQLFKISLHTFSETRSCRISNFKKRLSHFFSSSTHSGYAERVNWFHNNGEIYYKDKKYYDLNLAPLPVLNQINIFPRGRAHILHYSNFCITINLPTIFFTIIFFFVGLFWLYII